MGVAEQGEMRLDDLLSGGQVGVDGFLLLGQALSFGLDLVEPGLDLVLGELAVRGQVDEVLFGNVEAVDLLVEVLLEELLGLLLVGDGVVHEVADQLDVGASELLAPVVALDGVLDREHVVVRLGAGALGPVGAEEVEVLAAVSPDGPLDDQALVEASHLLALAAVDGALGEVVVPRDRAMPWTLSNSSSSMSASYRPGYSSPR